MILRDDGVHLYGFATDEERELFLQLISVAGVGPEDGARRAVGLDRRGYPPRDRGR